MTGLRAHLDLEALARNAAQADGVADLRRDAWGHGIAVVAAALSAAGVRAARVDPVDRAAAAAAGLTAVDALPTIDGRALFGLPSSPVLTASSRVLAVKRLLVGEGVSYGYTHRAAADTRIALVGGGYGQGVVRALGNRISVEIDGRLHPVVGRVAMDVCVVDVSDAPVSPGDDVVYFGGNGPARRALEDWEAASGLDSAELVCAVGLRAERTDAA